MLAVGPMTDEPKAAGAATRLQEEEAGCGDVLAVAVGATAALVSASISVFVPAFVPVCPCVSVASCHTLRLSNCAFKTETK